MAKPKHSIKGLNGGEMRQHRQVLSSWARWPPSRRARSRSCATSAGGKYNAYKKTKTKSNGKFRTPITQVGNKKTCFKVQVPATSVYKKTTSKVIGCITSR